MFYYIFYLIQNKISLLISHDEGKFYSKRHGGYNIMGKIMGSILFHGSKKGIVHL